ncbi:MAG: amino acid ABC transporter substrate-binding protein [Chloroflexi bacterium]|nr:amino acid ABC transporter substrate-binding protein [Chloroflexota bacterium]
MKAIRFGASISTSGRYALQGQGALAGLLAWAEATNAEGGVRMPGLTAAVPVALIHYDDGSSPVRAVANIERLFAVDRVQILIGPYSSDLTRAVASVSSRYGRVLWNHGGAADDIHRPGGRVVGILTPVSRYFAGVLELTRSLDPHARRAVVLHRRGSSFGRLAAKGARAISRETGFRTTTVTYSSVRDDLPRLLAKLSLQRPDLILSAGAFEDDCALAQELVVARVKAKAFGFVAAAMQDFQEALGQKAEGFLGPSQWEPGLGYPVDYGPAPDEGAWRIRAASAAPDYPAAQAYAACLIAQRCLQEAASTDNEALWQAACAFDGSTFFGRFRIDPRTGLQVGHEMVWVQWRGGRKYIVWPPDLAEGRTEYPRAKPL